MSFTSPEFRQNPDTGHRRGHRIALIAIVVGVLAIVIAVVVVVATRGHGGDRTAAPGGGQVPAQDSAPSTVTSSPITWLQVGPVQLPFSETAGPRVQEGVVAHGFAHTADGALIAARITGLRVGNSATLRSAMCAQDSPEIVGTIRKKRSTAGSI